MEFREKVVEDDIVLFEINGEFSVFYIEDIEKRVKELTSEGKHKFVFDLKNVNYIDSMGMAVIAIAGYKAHQNKTKAVVVGPSPKVRYAIESAHMGLLIHIAPTVEEGIDFFKSHSGVSA